MAFPNVLIDHKSLLTLNTRELPVYRDALIPGVDAQPLYLDPIAGVWVLRVMFHPGVVLPKHYHTGMVHLYTLSGRWNYVEYPEQPQTAGCYLFEPGGSIHTFMTPADNTEITDTFMVLHGANVNFDQDGNYLGIMDASDIMMMFDRLIRERGLEPARYIRAQQTEYTIGA
jgi:quercetin dioxygenase-like cupin family protein